MWSRARTLGATAALVASVWIGVRCISVFSDVQARARPPAPTHAFGEGHYRWAIEQRLMMNEGMAEAMALDLINRVWAPQSIALAFVALVFAFVGIREKWSDRLVFAVAVGWGIAMLILSYRFAGHS